MLSWPPAMQISARPSWIIWTGEIDRLDPGGADLVDGDAGDRFGKTRQDRGLAAGDLAGPGGDDLSHEDVIHIGRLDLPVRPAEDLLDGQGAEFRGGESLERPAEAAVGRPAGLDEDDLPEVPGGLFLPARRGKIGFPLAVFRHAGVRIFLRKLLFQFLGHLFHVYSPIVSDKFYFPRDLVGGKIGPAMLEQLPFLDLRAGFFYDDRLDDLPAEQVLLADDRAACTAGWRPRTISISRG